MSSTVPIGDCFRHAYKYVRAHGEAVLVHATVRHPWSGKRYRHAWAEDNGFVYDWQARVMDRPPLSVEAFYKVYKPVNVKRYSQTLAFVEAGRSKHFGPW